MNYLVFSNVFFVILILIWCCRRLKYGYREKTISTVIDRIAVGYFKYRVKDGVVIYANKGFLEIFESGEEPKDIIGSPLKKLFSPIDPIDFLNDRVTKKKQFSGFDARMKTLKGKEKIITYRGCVLTDPVTREDIAAVLIQDITREMEHYESMSRSIEKYKELFESCGDMVLMFDFISMRISEANPATESLTGYSHSELMTMNMEEVVHPIGREKIKELSMDLAFEEKASVETVLVCKNGRYRDVIFTLSGLKGIDGNMAMVVVKDMSLYSKKKEEQEVRRRETEEFLFAAIEREERINELRSSLETAKMKIAALEGRNGNGNGNGKRRS